MASRMPPTNREPGVQSNDRFRSQYALERFASEREEAKPDRGLFVSGNVAPCMNPRSHGFRIRKRRVSFSSSSTDCSATRNNSR
jgi:hypothetical protein